MRIFGYTIIKTSKIVEMQERIDKLKSQLMQAMKNDYRDDNGKFTKGP